MPQNITDIIRALGQPTSPEQPGVNDWKITPDVITANIATPKRQDFSKLLPFLISPGGIDPGAMKGMTADQVAQAMATSTASENLRMQSVAQIFDAMQGMGVTEHYRTAAERARVAEAQEQRGRMTLAERRIAGQKELRGVPQALAPSTIRAQETAADLRETQIKQFVDTVIGEDIGKAKISDLLDILGKEPRSTLPAEKEAQRRLQVSRAAEKEIMEAPDEEASRPLMDSFNQQTDNPWIYIWGTTVKSWWPDKDEAQKIMLARTPDGKQITGADIYRFAKSQGMTVEEFLTANPQFARKQWQ